MPAGEDLLLPEGSRLIHIGPHKTGTTSLQAALWNARPAMHSQGVGHIGRSRNPSNAVRSVVGQPSPYSTDTPPPIRQWNDLVSLIRRASEPRIVVSSEFFSWAEPEAIRRIVDELDPSRIRIAVTLRPLARILPSMWQQNVQAGRVVPFETWLHGVLDRHREKANPGFWMLHRHDELIARWADVVGVDRMTVVVVDERDHEFLLRVFEALLGLTTGTLALDPDLVNRSLTLPEAEAVRAFNESFDAEGLPRAVHARTMRFGAAQLMKRRRPGPEEPRVELPEWAIEPAVAIEREMVDRIVASGVRIVGDPQRLLDRPAPPGSEATPDGLPRDVVASMAMGILVASGATRDRGMRLGRLQFAEPIEVARVSTLQLASVLVGRSVNAAARRLRPIRRRKG